MPANRTSAVGGTTLLPTITSPSRRGRARGLLQRFCWAVPTQSQSPSRRGRARGDQRQRDVRAVGSRLRLTSRIYQGPRSLPWSAASIFFLYVTLIVCRTHSVHTAPYI